MAKKVQPVAIPRSIASAVAVPLLEEQLEKLKGMAANGMIEERAHEAWETFTRELLIRSFGSDSQRVADVIDANSGPLRWNMTREEHAGRRKTKVANQIAQLQSCIDQLKLDVRLQSDASANPLDRARAELLEDVFVTFSNDATLLDSEQFAIDNQDKITAYDSLLADGTLRHDSGNKLEFSLQSYIESKYWPKDEALLNQLVPIMKEIYSEKRTATIEVVDFIAMIERKGIMPRMKPINIERALRLFYRVGLLGGHSPANDDRGVPRIKSFSVSPMILRTNEIKDQLRHYTQSAKTISSAMTTAADLLGGARPATPTTENNKVFIVHGHNENARKGVADMIGKLDLEPIILHEKANQGLTLMEKFLKHSDVGFAIILMTADDTGKANLEDAPRPRARQNVVFEWGYFVGKLGRARVCALYEQGIDLPSDLHGIVYIPLDVGGHWRFSVLKELKAAGYTVDANKLLD